MAPIRPAELGKRVEHLRDGLSYCNGDALVYAVATVLLRIDMGDREEEARGIRTAVLLAPFSDTPAPRWQVRGARSSVNYFRGHFQTWPTLDPNSR